MSDKLTDRLRGNYKVGPNGEYGARDFSSFIPPICIEAADRIEELERVLLQVFEQVYDNSWIDDLVEKTFRDS